MEGPCLSRRDAGAAVGVLQAHAVALLREARRHSLCVDDAHDAYQRAVEIFLRRLDRGDLDLERVAAWLHVVVRHEAQAVRAGRLRLVAPDANPASEAPSAEPGPEERLAAAERLGRCAEALGRLKPAESRALLLRAAGHSYQAIQRETGWSYTKVNRVVTEGRRALRLRLAGIEAGEECARWASALEALATGDATSAERAQVRPHLRHCPACRAALGARAA